MATQPSVATAPVGEVRRFELPYQAVPGRLVNPAIGLCSMALRAGDSAPYTIAVTLLDAPDHRLIRADVWLAHRVIDGRGEWYLASDAWAPWLPTERIEPMGDADIPEELMDLVRPFRRGAPLGSVAALICERDEYALRGADAELLAVLRDDRVEIRSGGLITARYREVTVTGVADWLTMAQLTWLTEMLVAVGATRVARFPPLTRRLGAPASGLSDFPPPRKCLPGDSLESVWNYRLGRRLRALTYADLAIRGGADEALADIVEQLQEVRLQLRGLTPLLDEIWVAELVTQVDWAVASLTSTADPTAVLSSQRYLRLLDRLISASRAPALGDHGHTPGGAALTTLLATRLKEFLTLGGQLEADSPDHDWQQALTAATLLTDCCGVQVRPGQAVLRLSRRASKATDALTDCVRAAEAYAAMRLDELRPPDAFEAGRAYERLHDEERIARRKFIGQWSRRARRLTLEDKS
jgi:hypothetical protein